MDSTVLFFFVLGCFLYCCFVRCLLINKINKMELQPQLPKYLYELLTNVHQKLENPTPDGITHLVSGSYQYFHYKCDGHNDVVFHIKSLKLFFITNKFDYRAGDVRTALCSRCVPKLNPIKSVRIALILILVKFHQFSTFKKRWSAWATNRISF